MFRIASPFILVVLIVGALSPGIGWAKTRSVYVGTYTRGQSKGIYLLQFDPRTGSLAQVDVAVETENPSFLALHPNGKTLYAVNETDSFQGEATGAVSAFAIDRMTGKLRFLNQMASGGTNPCHLVLDQEGKTVLLANYSGGSVAAIRVLADGSLGPRSALIQHEDSSTNGPRQRAPHAHSINLDAHNRFAVCADLGIDRLLIYAFDPDQGSLRPHSSVALEPGAGPRHFAFHPNGQNAYAINERHSTITALAYDSAAGELSPIQTVSTLPRAYEDGRNSTAEIRVSTDGRFVYGSNRGHDSIAVFRTDPQSGRLTPIQHASIGGKTPRNFVLDPTGAFLLAAGQSTDNIVVFRVDPDSGRLTRTEHEISVPSPVCIRFGH